jgi:DNA-binding transcriptional regulator GbsR (MarR family)
MLGDRRDHFEAETDLWEMVTRIAQGRKEREIDPAAAALRACRAEAEGDPKMSATAKRRLAEMDEFVTTMSRWYDQMLGVPAPKLMALVRMGARVASIVGFGRGGRRKEPDSD